MTLEQRIQQLIDQTATKITNYGAEINEIEARRRELVAVIQDLKTLLTPIENETKSKPTTSRGSNRNGSSDPRPARTARTLDKRLRAAGYKKP